MNRISKNKAIKTFFFITIAAILIMLPFYSDIIKNFPINLVLSIFSKENTTSDSNNSQSSQQSNETVGSKLISLSDLAPESCKNGEYIMWNGKKWVCQKAINTQISKENTYTYKHTITIENKLTEEDVETYIFDEDNSGVLFSGAVDLESIIVEGKLPNSSLNDDVTVLGSSIDINNETTGALDFSRGGLGGPIPDPNGSMDNAALFWDGTDQSMQWLTFGSNLEVSGHTINSVDQYDGTVISVGTGNGLNGGTITGSGSISVNSPTCDSDEKLLWTGTAFACANDITNTGTVTGVTGGNGLSGGTITDSGTLAINSPTCTVNEKLRWNGTTFVCSADIDTTNPGTVTSVGTGNGLTGGSITSSGTISISSPTCLAGEKLSWSGTAFTCSTDIDTTNPGTVISVGSGNGLTGGTITGSGTLSITSPTCLSSEKLLWNGSAFICSTDITNTGTVTSVATGNGLTGGTITGSGTVAVSSPTCSGTDKLTWNGTAFACSSDTDTTNPGTVTSVGSGNGLTGGTITSSGSLSVSSPTCLSGERLSWNGTAFVCVTSTYSAGNDLDLTGTTFDIESQLDNVTTISRSASSLTLQTVSSGDIILDPAGGVGIGTATSGIKLNVVGTTRTTGFQLGTSSTSGYVLTTDSSGVGTWQNLPVASVYQTTTSKTGVRIWNGTGTTSGGVVTVNATSDGTSGGTALFTNIYSVQALAGNNTTTTTSMPLSSLKLISANKKTITINVIVGNLVSILGVAGVQNAPDGLTTYVTIIGD